MIDKFPRKHEGKKSDRLQIDSTCANKEVNEHATSSTINLEKRFRNSNAKMFLKKDPALNYIKNRTNLYLFTEDRDKEFNKNFYAIDYDTVYDFSIFKKYHLYENFEIGQRVRLFLDLDIENHKIPKSIKSEKDRMELFDKYVNDTIKLMGTILIKHGIANPASIVLSSCRPAKLSGHIIFPDVVFSDIHVLKFFMMGIKSQLIEDEIIDMNVYKVGSLRCLWNSKCGDGTNFEFYKSFNSPGLPDKELFMRSLICSTCDIPTIKYEPPTNIKVLKKQRPKQVDVIHNYNVKSPIVPVSILKRYVDMLSVQRADKYMSWLRVGMCLFNCNNSLPSFELWNEWSKKSGSYGGRDVCAYKWNNR